MKRVVATAINCIDGRTQIPVTEYIKSEYKVDHVDMITTGGVNKVLLEGEKGLIESIRKNAEISVKGNGSILVAVVGHFDCKGNPAGEEVQKEQILSAVKVVGSWGLGVELTGLWVDSDWKVSAVK